MPLSSNLKLFLILVIVFTNGVNLCSGPVNGWCIISSSTASICGCVSFFYKTIIISLHVYLLLYSLAEGRFLTDYYSVMVESKYQI